MGGICSLNSLTKISNVVTLAESGFSFKPCISTKTFAWYCSFISLAKCKARRRFADSANASEKQKCVCRFDIVGQICWMIFHAQQNQQDWKWIRQRLLPHNILWISSINIGFPFPTKKSWSLAVSSFTHCLPFSLPIRPIAKEQRGAVGKLFREVRVCRWPNFTPKVP